MGPLTYFAETAAPAQSADGDIFGALGIDYRLLIIQIVAFLVLVAIMGKFVYPWLMKAVDKRAADLEAAAEAAKEARAAADNNQAEVAKLLAVARKEAGDIITTAKTEAAGIVTTSETRARTTAERIVADAHVQLDKDVANARQALLDEAAGFVAQATEKVVAGAVDSKKNNALITSAVSSTEVSR